MICFVILYVNISGVLSLRVAPDNNTRTLTKKTEFFTSGKLVSASHLGCNREWHTDNPTDGFTNCTWVNMLVVENDDKSKIFF